MKIRGLLKKAKPTDQVCKVFVALRGNNQTELIYTGHTLETADPKKLKKYWDEKEAKPRNIESAVYKEYIRIAAALSDIVQQMQADKKPITPYWVKQNYLERETDTKEENTAAEIKNHGDKQSVVTLAEDYRKNHIFKLASGTQKGVRSSIQLFITFLNDTKRGKLMWSNLNHDVITDYERYIIEWDYALNTRGKFMKHLTWFLDWKGYDTSKIEVPAETKDIISLTFAELQKLVKVDVSKLVEWQKAKDTFLLGCYTGQRISDIQRISALNARDGYISLKHQKTGKNVKIPIIKDCADILKRYNGGAPDFPEQKVNEFIKKVCAKAGIDAPTTIETTVGVKRVRVTKPKWEFVTTHISGKTFITLAPERWGLTPAEIADIVGKDRATLLRHYFNDQAEIGRAKMFANDKPLMVISKKAS